jgi:hypothetical protein
MDDGKIDQKKLHDLFEYKNGDLIWKVKNCKGKKAGSLKPHGYIQIEIDNKNYSAHRLIWIMHNANFEGQIDHINGNRCDNRIENLRVVTQYQNQWNRKISRNNTVGIKGIRWRKDLKKFEVRLCVDGKQKGFGCFKDLELAELVMVMVREKHHGIYANHG